MNAMVVALATIAVTQTTGPPTPPTTGYPDCDKYIQMVSQCIRTQMPESDRAREQQRLEHFRGMLANPFAGASLAASCGENIRLEIQRDRYGCYPAEAARSGIPTPCSLVTRADLQLILATPLTEGQHTGSNCIYASVSGRTAPVTITVRWTDGREELESARAAQKQVAGRTRSSTGESVVTGRTLAGIGDDAFLIGAGLMPMLHVRKGDAAVIVTAAATQDQLTTIARKALERLPQ